MSSDTPDASNPTPPELNALDTRIDELRNRFPFIDTFKQSERSRHYIVQDLDQDANSANPYFFLKQCLFKDEDEFRYAFDYYKKYQHYCRGPFAKGDIIRLHQIYFAEDALHSYYELALVMDIGEPDRIDIEHIQPEQITKFLRTVCSLLEDVKKQESIYHGNICLKNIVLMSGELKISGFKPVFLGPDVPATWKTDLCTKHGHFRADLYMIGLLWLRFLGEKTDEWTEGAGNLEELDAVIQKALGETPEDRRVTIISNLLDLTGHTDLTLEEVIRQFEEWLVLDHYARTTEREAEQNGGALNVFDMEPSSRSEQHSRGARPNSRPENAGDNPFLQAMNQSEEEKVTLEPEDPTVKFKGPNDFLKIDGEFTLQDDDSILLQTANKSGDMQAGGRTNSHDRKSSDMLQPGFLNGIGANLVSSEKRLSSLQEKVEEDIVNSLRNIKSEAEGYGLGQGGPFKKEGKGKGSTADRTSHFSEHAEHMKIEGDTSGTHLSKTIPESESQMSEEPNIIVKEDLPAKALLSPEDQAEDAAQSKRSAQASNREPAETRSSHRSTPAHSHTSDRPEWIHSNPPPPKVELSERQLQEIEQQAVLKYLDEKEGVQREVVGNVLNIQERHEAASLKSERLKEKIQELGEKKLAQKKGKEGPGKPESRQEGKPKAPQTSQKADKKGQPNPKQEKAEANSSKKPKEPTAPTPRTLMTLPISQKSKNGKYGILTDPKKPFGLSTVRERDQLFLYTHDMQNKNISFKKMLKKVEPGPKHTGKIVDEKGTTRLVSAEPPKTPAPTLQGLVAENDIQKKTMQLPRGAGRNFSEVKAQLDVPALLDSIGEFADAPAAEAPKEDLENVAGEESIAQAGLPSTLESRFLNPESPSVLEKAVKHALEKDLPLEAVQCIQDAQDAIQEDSQLQLHVYTQLYSHFRRKGNDAARKAVLYEIVEALSQNPSLDEQGSLQQELILELAQLESRDGRLQHVLRLLHTDVFDQGIVDPESFYSLLGEAFVGLHDDKGAAHSFQKLLNEKIADSFVHFDITRLFTLTFRVFQLLHRAGSQLKLAKFFLRMLGALQDIKRVNEALHLRDNDYQNLLEIYVLNTLRFAREAGDFNLTNFVLHETVSKSLIEFEHNMNDEERSALVGLITDFCGHLARLVDFGGFRDNYRAFLEYAKTVLRASELTGDSLKRDLSVNFALAVFHLRAEDYAAAQAILDKSMASYFAFFQRPDPSMFDVLFHLGETLVRKDKFAEAQFYFQRILDLKCSQSALRTQALKELSKAEFRAGAFASAAGHIEVFLDHHFERSEANSYWKYLTLFFVSAVNVDPKRLESFYSELSQRQLQPGGKVFGLYLRSFRALQSIFAEHHEFKENAKHLAPIEAAAKSGKLSLTDCPKLLQAFAALFYKYVEARPSPSADLPTAFVREFVDPFLTVTENAHLLLHYLLNVSHAFVSLVPTFKERAFPHDARQRLFQAFNANVPKEVFIHFLNETIKKHNHGEVGAKDALNASKLLSSAAQSRILDKSPSADLLVSVTKDPTVCTCRAAYNGSAELHQLSKDFLKKIKESLFKDEFHDILVYYARFEKTLRERGVSFQKFEFVEQLITLHLSTLQKGLLDRPRLEALFGQMFAPGLLCWHDLKLLVLVLESFKDPQYLRYFVSFLDANHPNHASLVFNDVFLNSFNRKFETLVADLFRQIQDNKFAVVEGHFFARHLDFATHGAVPLTASLIHFDRLRYTVLNEEALLPIFNRHVNFDEIVKFYLRFQLFRGIRNALEGAPAAAVESLRKFKNELLGLLIRLRIEESHIVDLLYHLLLLARATAFGDPPSDEMYDSFLRLVQFLLDRYNFRMNYQYSRVLTEMGKVFFRNGNFVASLKAFMTSRTLLEDTNNVHPFEPSYVVPENREVHIFETHAFLVASHVEQKGFDNALIYLRRLETVKTEIEVLKLDRDVLAAMVDLGFQRTALALKIVFTNIGRLPSLSLSDLQRKLYVAIFDQLSLWVLRLTEKNEQALQTSEDKARKSTLDLYK